MGSDQSNLSGPKANRSESVKRQKSQSSPQSSPRPSISSDSDIPYISYTINKPIGDSPKSSKNLLRTSSTPSPRLSPKPPRPHSYSGPSSHNIIVVKEGVAPVDTLENDPDYIKLQSIPSFSPIMKGALTIPTVRDPEVLDKFDHHLLLDLCLRYQDHLKICAESVATHQNNLATKIREVDIAIVSVRNQLMEKQKKFAKCCEQLNKLNDISSTLKSCQISLSQTCETLDTLNEMLPTSERLEPFVMVTG